MAPKTRKRKRKPSAAGSTTSDAPKRFSNSPTAAATDEDKQNWQGFCEIESDPAFFNVMLNEFGVRDVKVQEVFGIDEVTLDSLPKPVYGLIFLFRYQEVDTELQEESCPDHVWFANQICGNVCATLAMLNIVNNVPDLDIGEHLRSFKDFTMELDSVTRGEQLNQFDFVKRIHNSFARKMDMLNTDLGMKNSYDDRLKTKRSRASKSSKKQNSVDEDAAFHFIAYLPIEGELWKLDGIDKNPQKLEPCTRDNWLALASIALNDRIARYTDDEIDFNLLSLVRAPVVGHKLSLEENSQSIAAVEFQLDRVSPDWQSFLTEGSLANGTNSTHSPSKEVLPEDTALTLEDMNIPPSLEAKIRAADTSELMSLRQSLRAEQASLKRLISDEEISSEADMRRANERRNDYAPFVREWLRMLAENGTLKDLIEERLPTKSKR